VCIWYGICGVKYTGSIFLGLLILSIAQVFSGTLAIAQTQVETQAVMGQYKCPGGFVNATVLLRDSLVRLYQIAVASNVSLPQQISAGVSDASNLSYDRIASMSSDECKRLYSNLLDLLKNLTSSMGMYLEPRASGAYERATLRAAEKLLERARDLNLSDVAMEISGKLSRGNVSLKDLEDLDKRVGAKEAILRAQEIRVIVSRISEEKIFKPTLSSKDLEAVSKAEEVLKRVRELLISVNASSSAIAAIDQAIDNVSRVKSILEREKALSEADRLRAIADRLDSQIRILVSTIRNISIDNATAQQILTILANVSKLVADARSMIQAGNLSSALKALEEAYNQYREAEKRTEDLIKKISKVGEDITERYREALDKLSELSREFEKVRVRALNISNPAIRELVSRIQVALQEASNISHNISQLISMGRSEDARAMINILLARINNIQALLETLKRLVEKAHESREELSKKLAEAVDETSTLWNRFQILRKNASNVSNPEIRSLIDMIQRSFEELNKTIANASKAIDNWNIEEATALLEKSKAITDNIKKMLETLENMLKEISRGRR
jgi:tetratricopeptide (TPR) repeat protein